MLNRPSTRWHLIAFLPCSDASQAVLRRAVAALDRPPDVRVRVAADDWHEPGSRAGSYPVRDLRFTLAMAGREFPLSWHLAWYMWEDQMPPSSSDPAAADRVMLSLAARWDCLPVPLHGTQNRVDDWDFRIYRRYLVEPLAAQLGAIECRECMGDDPDLTVVTEPVSGHQRYIYNGEPTRFYDLRKPTRYFVLETDARLTADLCQRVSVLLRAGGLSGLDEEAMSVWHRTSPYTYEDVLEQNLLSFDVDLEEQDSLDEMVARGRVILAFYLARTEHDGKTEASLVRVLLYPAPGDPTKTRIHVTPESCHVHGVPITGAPWSGCDWDFRLYREGPVRTLIEQLPARFVRETELDWPEDEDARQLDAYEHPDDEPYWPRYRALVHLGFEGDIGPDALR